LISRGCRSLLISVAVVCLSSGSSARGGVVHLVDLSSVDMVKVRRVVVKLMGVLRGKCSDLFDCYVVALCMVCFFEACAGCCSSEEDSAQLRVWVVENLVAR
jgi:hypothetical protein